MKNWTIKTINENLRELEITKTKHPETVENLKEYWNFQLETIKNKNMYKRNQLIYAQKQFNEQVDSFKPEGKSELDIAIEQVDFLLTFINK